MKPKKPTKTRNGYIADLKKVNKDLPAPLLRILTGISINR
jgi:hypothetical protein